MAASLPGPDVLLLVGDGRSGRDDFCELSAGLAQALHMPVQTAFLHMAAPSVGEGILNGVLEHRPSRVVVMPLLAGASQSQKDNLRQIVDAARDRWRDVLFYEAQPPGAHPGIIEAYHQLVAAAARDIAPANDTALLVVGRGSRDAHHNAEVYQMARLLWERFPAGLLEVAFHGVTVPDVPAAIRRCVHNGARRMIVLPYVLYDRHTYTVIQAQAVCADAALMIAPPPGLHVGIVEAVRQRLREALSVSHSHSELDGLLPPRYQGGVCVSPAPMSAADLVYDAAGQVAWDAIWGDFCDLALAGGPPHRGTLLEPATPESVAADPDGYERVLAELARGIRMITGLPVVASAAPGWIGVRCAGEDMALWLLRAIVVENVSVRREGEVLYLPAGPGFRLEHEIKNVITVVAKTHHYWTEHLNAAVTG